MDGVAKWRYKVGGMKCGDIECGGMNSTPGLSVSLCMDHYVWTHLLIDTTAIHMSIPLIIHRTTQ